MENDILQFHPVVWKYKADDEIIFSVSAGCTKYKTDSEIEQNHPVVLWYKAGSEIANEPPGKRGRWIVLKIYLQFHPVVQSTRQTAKSCK